jgi:hypothetical protein
MVSRTTASPMRACGCGASWELLDGAVGLVVIIVLSVSLNRNLFLSGFAATHIFSGTAARI